VKIASTTTVDCSGKNALAPQWKMPDRKSPVIAKETMQQRNNNKNKTNPTPPVFEDVLPRLGSQNCGRTTCLQGKTALL
jgi:hypothetical protein